MSSLKRPYDGHSTDPVKRPTQGGDVRANVCALEEPHECAVPCIVGKKGKKFYAIWGGPNPGIHKTVWDVARNWIDGHNVKQKSYPSAAKASEFYRKQKALFPDLAPRFQQPRAAAQTPRRDFNNCPAQPQRPTALEPEIDDNHYKFLSLHTPQREVNTSSELPASEREDCTFLSRPILPFEDDPAEPPLSPEQVRLVNLIVEGKNVFYTGSAGVGKSRVLKAFRQHLSVIGKKVNVIAPTGRAALDINGSTTWSYAGWTPEHMKRPLDMLQREAWQKKTKKRLQNTDVLVIDEVSMVENFHLERLSAIMKSVRQNGEAFGGVQVVVTGDFCQLPPVKPFQFCIDCGKALTEKARKSAYECTVCRKVYNDEDKWAFQSNAWKEANFEYINLDAIFRQRDRAFIKILQKLRIGMPLLAHERELLCQDKPPIDKAVRLYPQKKDVKRINDAEYRKLRAIPHTYHSKDHLQLQQHHRPELEFYANRAADGTLIKLAEHRYEPHLELKEGMLVVLLANISILEGLVNGAQGTIVGFQEFWDPTEEQKPEEQIISDIQVSLGGDYTYYRAQRIFEFMSNTPLKRWPVVRFSHKGQTKELPIMASCYPTELGDEPPSNPRYSLLSRTQIPLMAAWAMTIHKSQGMTLEKVEVDLSKNFEEGMAYVAFSRATTLEGLRVISFPENAEMGCNQEVRAFLQEKFHM